MKQVLKALVVASSVVASAFGAPIIGEIKPEVALDVGMEIDGQATNATVVARMNETVRISGMKHSDGAGREISVKVEQPGDPTTVRLNFEVAEWVKGQRKIVSSPKIIARYGEPVRLREDSDRGRTLELDVTATELLD